MSRPLAAAFLLALPVCASAASTGTLSGLDVLIADGFKELQGKRVGLITNQTGRARDGRTTIEVLAGAPGVTLSALFVPEHGLQGSIEEGQPSSGTFRLADGREIPLYNSLYAPGLAKASRPELLAGAKLDALVFDIQDIGARFYTYAASMGIAMEAAAAAGLRFYVLDRPDPVDGKTVEGPLLAPDIRHITAYFPVPVRHGLTMGEIARLHAAGMKTPVDLVVIPLRGWKRSQWYDETGLPWTKPSPNMPDVDAAALYPGIGCFESTNLAVGRGTPIPFRWIGAPWLEPEKVLGVLRKAKLPGVEFSAETFTPSKSVYEGKSCPGIRMRITDRRRLRPFDVFIHLVCALRETHPRDFAVRWDEIRRMVGNDRFKELYESGASPKKMLGLFRAEAESFKSSRKPYLLY